MLMGNLSAVKQRCWPKFRLHCPECDGFLGVFIILAQELSWECSRYIQLCWAEEPPCWVLRARRVSVMERCCFPRRRLIPPPQEVAGLAGRATGPGPIEA